jgi:hypothetical protein
MIVSTQGTWDDTNKGPGYKNGGDITQVEWADPYWWGSKANFASSVWTFRIGLPILNDMPGSVVQNPQVTP